jgi:hypothetical protein
MNKPSAESLYTLDVLRRAVANALERKRRLGQYAVIWQDGRPFIVNPQSEQAPLVREESRAYQGKDKP